MQRFPPFIINIPVLFERYVYILLVERYGDHNIGYQVATQGNIMDFMTCNAYENIGIVIYGVNCSLPNAYGKRQ